MKSKNQIFYDQSRWRWKIVRIFLLIVLVLFLGGIVGLVLGTLIRPEHYAYLTEELNIKAKDAKSLTLKTWQPTDLNLILRFYRKDYYPKIENTSVSEPKEIYAFYQTSDLNGLESFYRNSDNIDHLFIDLLYLKNVNGDIQEINNEAKKDVHRYIAEEKLPIETIPTLSNYDNDDYPAETIIAILSSSEATENNIAQLANYAQTNDFKAINISYFNIPHDYQSKYLQYLEKLTATLNEKNIKVFITLPLDDQDYDYKKISTIVDAVVLTAYNQTIPTDKPGPIASQVWLVDVLQNRLKDIPAEKLILTFGNFGYDWSGSKAKTITFFEAIHLVEKYGATTAYDTNALNPKFGYTDNNGVMHEVWLLDATTFYNHLAATRNYNLKGYALWYLGSEDPSLWKFFNQKLDLNENKLKEITQTNGVTFFGDGGLLRIAQKPKNGEREYTLEKKLIVAEKYITYPSDYLIDRGNFVNDKKVVLTFDDGPDKIYTAQIIEVLRRYQIPATFFVIGTNANNNAKLTQEIGRDFEIGNHTFTHPDINNIQPIQLKYELNATQRVIENITGHSSTLFRSPYGLDENPDLPDNIKHLVQISELDYYNVNFGVDSLDWHYQNADIIANKVIDDVRKSNNKIVLLHDGGGDRSTTVEALPKIIETLKKEGYEFSTIAQAMGLDEKRVMPQAPSTIISQTSGYGYNMMYYINFLIGLLFVIGIAIGISRFGIISSFTITAWIKTKRKVFLEFEPEVTAVIASYNEEKVISKTIRSLLATKYEHLKIIVVNDGSKDRTLQVLVKHFSANPKVTILNQVNKGKAAALNRGIRLAKSKIIITLDADTIIGRKAITMLVGHFRDKKVGAVAGNAKVGNRINLLTNLQAIEYITAQGYERRAFNLVNSITVVPGAIGAWRKSAILKAGGFTQDTLAEDADLTVNILKNKYRIEYEHNAIAYTEAPDNIKAFLRQRFRWVYGTFQVGWKNRNLLFRRKYGMVGFFGIPNILFFQLLFSVLAPIVDIMIVWTLLVSAFQYYNHPLDYSFSSTYYFILFYALFMLFDLFIASLSFLMEKNENLKLILYLPLQRFFYRQLIYYITWRALSRAIKGSVVGWENTIRKNSAKILAPSN